MLAALAFATSLWVTHATALQGITCGGSPECDSLTDDITTLATSIYTLPDSKVFQDGQMIFCDDNSVCAFLQGTGTGGNGKLVKDLTTYLISYGCQACGSIAVGYPISDGVGELVIDYRDDSTSSSTSTSSTSRSTTSCSTTSTSSSVSHTGSTSDRESSTIVFSSAISSTVLQSGSLFDSSTSAGFNPTSRGDGGSSTSTASRADHTTSAWKPPPPSGDIAQLSQCSQCHGHSECTYGNLTIIPSASYAIILGVPALNCGNSDDPPLSSTITGSISITDTWSEGQNVGVDIGPLKITNTFGWSQSTEHTISQSVTMIIPPGQQGVMIANVTYNRTAGNINIGSGPSLFAVSNQPKDYTISQILVPCGHSFAANVSSNSTCAASGSASSPSVPSFVLLALVSVHVVCALVLA